MTPHQALRRWRPYRWCVAWLAVALINRRGGRPAGFALLAYLYPPNDPSRDLRPR